MERVVVAMNTQKQIEKGKIADGVLKLSLQIVSRSDSSKIALIRKERE